jgi:hypothetical protein
MLGGGRITEAMRTHGVSRAQAYSNFHRVVRAINSTASLAILFPSTTMELKSTAARWKARSKHGLFEYLIGCIDGLFLKVKLPPKTRFMNQNSFYSDSKKAYGISFQGICDSQFRFLAFTCGHKGCTNDVDAYEQGDLLQLVKGLKFPYHLNGDGAYVDSSGMMSPYPGTNLHLTDQDSETFNWFHSSLRILIEITFGIFIQKWGIFWKPIEYDITFTPEIVHACVRLHNFAIDNKVSIINQNGARECPLIDEDGRLVGDEWRHNRNIGQVREAAGNVLKDHIKSVIRAEGLVRLRSHHKH